jgi:hypothetical protein
MTAQRRMSRHLMRAARNRAQAGTVTVGELIGELGDRSFGWAVLVFALVNLMPLPLGANMITSIPLLILTAQMATGAPSLRLPSFVMNRPFDRRGFQRAVLRVSPLVRPLERIIRPRTLWVFEPEAQRFVGVLLFAVALSLFAPIPFSGWLPAGALFLAGFGLIERDGAVLLAGLALGLLSIVVTLGVVVAIVAGLETVIA